MVKKLLRQGSGFLTKRQGSVLSAATVIMLMITFSRILGLFRNRILAHFFTTETLSMYFAAFRLPEFFFEILIFGSLASAFVPTFTHYLSKKEEKEAWYIANVSLNIGLVIFAFLAIIFFIFTKPLYHLIAPGFNSEQINLVVRLAQILIFCQGFFIFSFFLTGVLESFQRFLVPAIAPLFYNLGIILGTIILAPKIGIYGPVVGAVIGAFFHFLIQLPLATHLGFRPQIKLDIKHPGVREIGRLAMPRVIELTFLQISKSAELFFSTLVSVGAFTYYTFANSLQLLPIGLFGTSIAKASLPMLSYQSANGDLIQFRTTFTTLFNQIVFLTIPSSIFLAILRVPVVRIVFGAGRFDWLATVQTGYVLSAFCFGITAQALIYLLNRAFYAFHDTKTPVKISIISQVLYLVLGLFLILILKLPIWSLALAFSISAITQFLLLLIFLKRKISLLDINLIIKPLVKILFSAVSAGLVMYLILKKFDRVIFDTRYVSNLIILTAILAFSGLSIYLVLVKLLKVEEIKILGRVFRRLNFSQLDQDDVVGA